MRAWHFMVMFLLLVYLVGADDPVDPKNPGTWSQIGADQWASIPDSWIPDIPPNSDYLKLIKPEQMSLIPGSTLAKADLSALPRSHLLQLSAGQLKEPSVLEKVGKGLKNLNRGELQSALQERFTLGSTFDLSNGDPRIDHGRIINKDGGPVLVLAGLPNVAVSSLPNGGFKVGGLALNVPGPVTFSGNTLTVSGTTLHDIDLTEEYAATLNTKGNLLFSSVSETNFGVEYSGNTFLVGAKKGAMIAVSPSHIAFREASWSTGDVSFTGLASIARVGADHKLTRVEFPGSSPDEGGKSVVSVLRHATNQIKASSPGVGAVTVSLQTLSSSQIPSDSPPNIVYLDPQSNAVLGRGLVEVSYMNSGGAAQTIVSRFQSRSPATVFGREHGANGNGLYYDVSNLESTAPVAAINDGGRLYTIEKRDGIVYVPKTVIRFVEGAPQTSVEGEKPLEAGRPLDLAAFTIDQMPDISGLAQSKQLQIRYRDAKAFIDVNSEGARTSAAVNGNARRVVAPVMPPKAP